MGLVATNGRFPVQNVDTQMVILLTTGTITAPTAVQKWMKVLTDRSQGKANWRN